MVSLAIALVTRVSGLMVMYLSSTQMMLPNVLKFVIKIMNVWHSTTDMVITSSVLETKA